MNAIDVPAAGDAPAGPAPHDVTDDRVAGIAARLLRDAVAAAGGSVSPIHHEAASTSSPLPLGEAGRRPGEGAGDAARIPGTLTPPPLPEGEGLRTVASHVDAGPAPIAGAAVDVGAIRSFVARIRGLDHLQLPPVLSRPLAATPIAPTAAGPFDVEAVRRDFPILHQRVHGKPLAWLDNAATTQKPQAVIHAISSFYAHDNSNIHRGAHTLAARATDAYERARRTVAEFLGAPTADEIVFVRGCTEGVNLVANALAPGLARGDEIVLPELEHHANIVPWQMVAERTGAVIRVAPIDDRGDVILEAYERLLGPRTRIVAMSHASNSLGTILPVELMTAMAKARGARVLVDGAQSVAHFPVDVRRIGCDFYVFSGHKIFGPTGIGAVFMARDAQESLPPWQGGGNMIQDVTFTRTTYADPPAKFEAGTPNIADAIGLGAALDYVTALGRERIAAYEHGLLEEATVRLAAIPGLRLVGTARAKVGVLSFVIPGHDPVEIGRALDREGIAVRAGHHCAQPSLRHFGLEATVRPSLAFYNTSAEIDRLAGVVAHLSRT